jgi:hypothetical protein
MILKIGEMQMNNFIGELHKLFDIINKDKFDGKLIEPVITVSREKSKSKKKIIFGWCTLLPIWTKVKDGKETQHHEINMTIDYIDAIYHPNWLKDRLKEKCNEMLNCLNK